MWEEVQEEHILAVDLLEVVADEVPFVVEEDGAEEADVYSRFSFSTQCPTTNFREISQKIRNNPKQFKKTSSFSSQIYDILQN
jgi:hypothetical protein